MFFYRVLSLEKCDYINAFVLQKKNASPCLPFNTVNMIGSYVFTLRCFNGEHLEWPSQAGYIAWNLSGTLSNNQNFESMLDAITSVAVNMTQVMMIEVWENIHACPLLPNLFQHHKTFHIFSVVL